MATEFRARATITSRKPASDAEKANGRNTNRSYTVKPGEKFNPAEIGVENDQLRMLIERRHVAAIGTQGENLDVADSLARMGAPARVPTTTERDQRTGGAAPQVKGGPTQGNTSPPAGEGNREPHEGATVHSDVSQAPSQTPTGTAGKPASK